MQLFHIKEEICSVCGSRAIYEEQPRQHSCGQWFEKRKFDCGRQVAWSPNFNQIVIDAECPKHHSQVQLRKDRASAKASLLDHLDALNIDDEFKHRMKQQIEAIYR